MANGAQYAIKIIYKGSGTKAEAATALGLTETDTPYLYSILEVVPGSPALGELVSADNICKCPPFSRNNGNVVAKTVQILGQTTE